MAATRVRNAAISAALWLSLLPYSSYVALAPLIQAEWSATHAQTGAVYAAYLAGYAVAAVFVVPRLDRTGPTRFWRIGLLLMGAAHFGFTVLPPGWLSALPLRAAAGAGHVVAMTAAVQIVSGSVRHDRRAAALGLLIAAGYLGTTSSYLITGAALRFHHCEPP